MMERDAEMRRSRGALMSIAWCSPFRDDKKGIFKAKCSGNGL